MKVKKILFNNLGYIIKYHEPSELGTSRIS